MGAGSMDAATSQPAGFRLPGTQDSGRRPTG